MGEMGKMKSKFVKVWDRSRGGWVKFIVLQVEKTDTFLVEANFNPGYKFIIQATYHQVGATGGHTFIPAYGEGVTKTSKTISAMEGEVLGFYLSKINDIYDVPDDLYTDNFWSITETRQIARDINDYDNEDYYKVLISSHIMSFMYMKNCLESLTDEEADDILGTGMYQKLKDTNRDMQNNLNQIGADLERECDRLELAFINKKTHELAFSEQYYGENSDKNLIAKYLWLPNDELPLELWKKVTELNDNLGRSEIYRPV